MGAASVVSNHERLAQAGRGPLGVLFIIDELRELGGAERVLLRLVENLPRNRFAPRILTFALNPRLDIEGSVSCPLEVIPLRRTYDWQAVRAAVQIRGIVRSHAIQITHTFHETSDLWGGMIAKLSGCPILISSRRDMGFQRQGKHRVAYRALAGSFDEVHAVSEQVRQFCIRQDGLNPERAVTVYNGIDLPSRSRHFDRRAERARFGLPADAPVVVSVGHIRSVKGFDVFLEAAAQAGAVIPDAVFAIAGSEREPDYVRHLQKRAAALGLGPERFRFLGPVQDIPAFLYSADLFCLMSRTEGMSNALIEAMACELPCIATGVGGSPEVVVHGKTGYLVESGDAESAGRYMRRLLQDPALCRAMGAGGRRAVEEKFTTRAMVGSVIESYERLLELHSRCA